MSNIAVIEPRPPTLASGAKIAPIIPTSMEEAYRLATAVCRAGLAPYGLDTPEKAMIAIMHGMEIGLPPMMSLQRIAVVNGRPTIWGDAALALVRASGLCEWVEEKVEGEGDARRATCKAKRKGEPSPVSRSFSVADAKTAKLWGKMGSKGPTPWVTSPDRMLQMRARGFCLRDAFADVLGGLYIKEEMDDDAPRDASRPAPPNPNAQITAPAPAAATPVTSAVRRPPNPNAPKTPEAPVEARPIDFDAFRAALDAAESIDEANAIYEREISNRQPPLRPDEIDEADALLRECGARFWDPEASE